MQIEIYGPAHGLRRVRRFQRGANDHAWPLFEQDPPATEIWPSTFPDTAYARSDGAAPVIVPAVSTMLPCVSRADPEIVPVTDAGATVRLRTSGDAPPGARTVAVSPDRSTDTLNEAAVCDGLPMQRDVEKQLPFSQVARPVVDNVTTSVYEPLSSVTARGAGTGPAELGELGEPPHEPAISKPAARRTARTPASYSRLSARPLRSPSRGATGRSLATSIG